MLLLLSPDVRTSHPPRRLGLAYASRSNSTHRLTARSNPQGGLPRRDTNADTLHLGEVEPGDVVQMTFPITERTDVVDVWMRMNDNRRRFTLVRRGNEVADIYPRGRIYPYYDQRQHYRSGEPRWRKVVRFVSGKDVYCW